MIITDTNIVPSVKHMPTLKGCQRKTIYVNDQGVRMDTRAKEYFKNSPQMMRLKLRRKQRERNIISTLNQIHATLEATDHQASEEASDQRGSADLRSRVGCLPHQP